MKLLNSGNKENYWPEFKKLHCKELQDRQNAEAVFKARQMDVEAIVKRQIEFLDRQMPQGKIVVEHSPNLNCPFLMCGSIYCVTCQNPQNLK